MWKTIKSIRTKILISFVLVFIIPTLFGLYFATHLLTERIQIALKDTLRKNASLVRNKLRYYERASVMAEIFASNEELRTKIFLKRSHQVQFLAELMKRESGASFLSIYDDAGKPLTVLGEPLKIPIKNKLKKQSGILSENGNLYLYSASPIIDNNVFLGSLQISFLLNNHILSEFEPLIQSKVYIIKGNRIIATTSDDTSAELVKQFIQPRPGKFFTVKKNEKDSYMIMKIPIRDIKGKTVGGILVSLPDKDIHLAFTTTKKRFIRIGLFLILLAVLLAIFFSWQIVYPIRDLSSLLNHAMKGDLSRRAKIYSHDEIGELADSFNMMSEKLENAQQKLIQTEKLASIGKLAAGMSHEINNPLVSILGYSELARERLGEQETLDKYLKYITRDAVRCKQIIDHLLTFAREKQKHIKEEASVPTLIEESVMLMEHIFRKKNIHVKLSKKDGLPPVYVSINEIKRVFLNLLGNAIDALGENGILEISIALETGDENSPGYVIVVFRDNGCGIPDDIITKIFDPFFTTKDVGSGTGLGLSLSYGIINDHGGTIEVESEAGKGTTFTVKIPVAS